MMLALAGTESIAILPAEAQEFVRSAPVLKPEQVVFSGSLAYDVL